MSSGTPSRTRPTKWLSSSNKEVLRELNISGSPGPANKGREILPSRDVEFLEILRFNNDTWYDVLFNLWQ